MLHPRASFVALSQDGRWMASAGWNSKQIRLWDVQSGRMLLDMPIDEESKNVFFTPDNRNLIVALAGEVAFWDVETRQVTRRLPRDTGTFTGYVAFSADGKLMALDMAPGVIHLKEVSTGRTVAKLEDPFGDRPTWLAFTPDGTQLVVGCKFAHLVHIWDLRAIRVQLKAMALDWDWPEFPPPGKSEGFVAPSPAAPMTIRVIEVDTR
jgi:WD40 repeat protein